MDTGTVDDEKEQSQPSDKKQRGAYSKSDSSNNPESTHIGSKPRPNKLAMDRQFCLHILKSFCRRFLRGFTGGVLLYSGVRVVTALLRNPFRKKVPKIWQGIFTKDCARLALFCALYPSVYHLLVEVVGALQKQKNGWTYSISGGLAGLSIAVLDKSRRQTLAFFTVSRALGAGLSTLVTRGHVSAVPFFEVGVFCACTSVIVYCTALNPQYLNAGYYKSILKWSRDYTEKNVQPCFRDQGTHFVTCQEGGFHEGSCLQHGLVDFLRSLPGFAKLYLPIHVTPVILFKRKTLKDRPLYVLKSLAKNMLLSTVFLGALVFLVKITICMLRNLTHIPPPIPAYIPSVAGAVAGLALLLERYSRRKELTMFVIPHILTVVYNIAKRSQLWQQLRVPHGFTLIFALSMMSMMHAYEREPESLTLLISGVLKVFVGSKSSSQRITL